MPIIEVNINQTDMPSGNLAIDINNNGQKLIAWRGNNGIFASYAQSELNFSSPQKIADIEGIGYLYGGIDANGNALLVWTKDYFIWTSYFLESSGLWSTPVQIGDTGSSVALSSFDICDNGSAVLLWQSAIGGAWYLYASNCVLDESFHRSWTSPVLLNESDVYQTFSVDMTDDGNAIAVWSRQFVEYLSNQGLASSFYTNQTGWGDIQPLPKVTGMTLPFHPYYPEVDMNNKGDAVVVYVSRNDRKIYANRFDINSGWQEPELLREEQGGDPEILRPDIDDRGRILAFWHPESYSAIGFIEFRRYNQFTGWKDVEALSMIGDISQEKLQLDLNNSGQGVLGWQETYMFYDEERNLYVSLHYNLSTSTINFYSKKQALPFIPLLLLN